MTLNAGLLTSATPEYETPQALYDALNAEFGFTLDPCATADNAKCEKFYTKEQDGLAQDWTGERVYMNPPYGREIGRWVAKLAAIGGVGLLPARTDTSWYHEHINGKAEVRFIRGRLRFNGMKGQAPFPSMVVVFPPIQRI